MMNNRDAYILKTQMKLNELNISLVELKNKIEQKANLAYEKSFLEVKKLQAQSLLIHTNLDAIKLATEESLESLVDNTEALQQAFINSCRYFQFQMSNYEENRK
ncbi:hypothetical protein ACO0LB_20235 [Undibacterium sp. SXout7W]|uniref:hypothetical protein n=1 Tax=Undibacterium sp. SXout7W TaxID=3413049 RepID=UPI003BEF7F47